MLINIFILGLPSNGYPAIEQTQSSYPNKPSSQPSYPSQNIYPSGYPQQPNVPDYGTQEQSAYPGYVGSGYPIPPPSGPLPNYPQSGPPSGYSGYFGVYPGQNQIYSEQPDFALYPQPGAPLPFNGNIYGYPEQQYTFPAIENKSKYPQVTTPVPSISSTESLVYNGKSSPKPSGYNSKPSVTDLRVVVPSQPEFGQKSIVLGKNDLFGPSSGSTGYSSTLTPQYVNNPTKSPIKTPHHTGQESNLVIISSSIPDSSTPVYSVSTRVASEPKSVNSEEPSTTASYEEQFSTLSPDSSTPVNVIPYPLPIVPNPGSCPCYFVPPTNSSANQQPQPLQTTFDLNNLPKGAVIGFIPVVFYPSCGAASKEVLSSKLDPIFPSAYQVPYKCSYCEQSQSQTATIKNSFDQVIKQSELSPTIDVRSLSRKNYPNAPIFDQQEFGKKIKVVRRKSKDEQN